MKCGLSRLFALVAALGFALAGPAAAEDANTTTQRILELESMGRARVAEAATQLEQLRPSTAEFSAQRLELLTVQGLMLAVASQAEGAERAAAELEAWGTRPGAPLAAEAGAAALLVRARATARSGNLQQADTLMQRAMKQLPATAQARERVRFVTALGYIRNESGKLEDAVRLNHEALALADQVDEAWRQSEARSSLAYSYYNAKQFERARALNDEAITLASKTHDDVSLARAYNTAAIVLTA